MSGQPLAPDADDGIVCTVCFARSVLLVLLALGLTSCGRAPTEGATTWVAPQNEQSDAGISAADNIADAPLGSTLYLYDLKLPKSSYNDNDTVASKPIKLPGTLERAAFGFFDDPAIMQQVGRPRLIEMLRFDFGFRFVADLDRNGQPETYRVGWFQLPGQAPGQFLAVFEKGALRDVWTAEADEPISISWRDGMPIVFPCNCATSAPIVYADGKLRMRWSSD